MSKEKIAIITFGCSMNQADSEVMKGLLNEQKYIICDDIDEADLIIVNSCTVKNTTEKNFWNLLDRLNKKNKKIIVAGCIAQSEPDKLADFSLIGTTQINKICEAVQSIFEGQKVKLIKKLNSVSRQKERLNLPKIRKNKVVEIIPISQGCLGSCTFCKTKAARFNLFSYDIVNIVEKQKRQ